MTVVLSHHTKMLVLKKRHQVHFSWQLPEAHIDHGKSQLCQWSPGTALQSGRYEAGAAGVLAGKDLLHELVITLFPSLRSLGINKPAIV